MLFFRNKTRPNNSNIGLEYSQQGTFQTSIFDKSEIVLKIWDTNIEK